MTGPPPSGIRRFYGKIESVGDRNEKYLCGLCSTVVSSSVAATSNLIKHMRRHHPKEFEDYQREQGRTDLDTPSRSSSASQPRTSGSANAERRTGGSANPERRNRVFEECHETNVRRLVCFLAATFLPPSIAETPSFAQFVHGLEPRFTIPSSHQLKMVILPQTYDDLRDKLKDKLSRTQGVCLTLDTIKDDYGHYFFIILVSYITSDWKKSSALLTCKIFRNVPSESSIKATYESTVRTMNIVNKIQCIVIGKVRKIKKSDMGFIGWEFLRGQTVANNVRSDEDYKPPLDVFDTLWQEHPLALRCFNDVLQDVVRRGIEEAAHFSEQIQKISSIVYSINVLVNGRDGSRVFSSTHDWTEQIKFLKTSLRCSLEVFQCAVSSSLALEDQQNFFTNSDRSILNELVEVLEAFEDASDRLHSTNGIASSQVLPIVRGLRHHLRSLRPSHLSNVVKVLSEALEDKLSVFETNEVLQRASMVDPRFKTAWCSSEEEAALQSKLQKSVVQIKLKEPDVPGLWSQWQEEDAPKRPKLFAYMTSERALPKQWMSSDVNECARDEVNRFLASPCREHDINPLDFWRGMETEFPLIAVLARRSLCTPVSTGSIRDIFGEDEYLSRGIHLSCEEFERLAFLKANMEI